MSQPPQKQKKRLTGGGGFLLVIFGIVLVAIIISVIPKSNTPAPAPANPATAPTEAQAGVTTSVASNTALPAATTAQAPAPAAATPQPATTVAATTSNANANANAVGVIAPGPGQELIGQSGTYANMKATVTKVDRFSEIKGSGGKVIKSQGVFLVVSFDLENLGDKPAVFIFAGLLDAKGREFSASGNIDATVALSFSGQYKTDTLVQPSFKGKDYKIFEVPADASGLKLKVGI